VSGSRYLRPIHTQAELREAVADVLADSQCSPPLLLYDHVPRMLYALQIIGSSLKTAQPARPVGRPKGEKPHAKK